MVKTNDSSRGFALRLENNGRYAWVGLAFRDRSDAFYFSVIILYFIIILYYFNIYLLFLGVFIGIKLVSIITEYCLNIKTYQSSRLLNLKRIKN